MAKKAKKKATKKKAAKKKGKATTPKRLTKKEIAAAVKKGGTQQHLKGMLDKKDQKLFNAGFRIRRANTKLKHARDEVAASKQAALRLMQKRKGKTYDDGEICIYMDLKEAVIVKSSSGRKQKRK